MKTDGREKHSKLMSGSLRKLLKPRQAIMVPGAFNAATARLIARDSFPAVYVSGAGLANATAGVPDIGLLSLEEVVHLAGYITAAVNVPVIADADTGFDDPAKTVKMYQGVGLAGLHIEDQVFPKRCGHLEGKKLVSHREMSARIAAAVKARAGKDFLIIARTDARSVEGIDAAIDRAHSYINAGADAIFPEALETFAEFREFAQRVDSILLANMTEFGRTPLITRRRLIDLGYHMAIYPQTAFRVAMRSEALALRSLAHRGGQLGLIGRMQSRADLYELMGYDPKADKWP